MIPFEFQKPNKTSGCEDARPVSKAEYAIVCDGLGGSGSTVHTIDDSGTFEKHTSAYLGSRIVAQCVDRYFNAHKKELETEWNVSSRLPEYRAEAEHIYAMQNKWLLENKMEEYNKSSYAVEEAYSEKNYFAHVQEKKIINSENYIYHEKRLDGIQVSSYNIIKNDIIRSDAARNDTGNAVDIRIENVTVPIIGGIDRERNHGTKDPILIFLRNLVGNIYQELEKYREKWKIEYPRSRTLKIFPTTLASVLYFPSGDTLKMLAVWAGDSRVYILSPSKGLQLLSLDDAEHASEAMNSSSSMNNCISAGNPFRLNYALYEMDEPGIVFCCSDGCFDYMQSPLHFEWLLLNTILECMPACEDSKLGESFALAVCESVYSQIGDDTTMAGVFFRISSQSELKALYQPRMDAFGKKAEEMNEYLKKSKQLRDRKDMERKNHHLVENKISDVMLKVIGENAEILSQLGLSNSFYTVYKDKRSDSSQEIAKKYKWKSETILEKSRKLELKCRELWRSDVIVDIHKKEWFSSYDVRNVLKDVRQIIETFKILYAKLESEDRTYHSEKRSVSFSSLFAALGDMENLVQDMKENKKELEDLWSQSYFSTSKYRKEHEDFDNLREFENVLKNPDHYSYLCSFTREKISQLQQNKKRYSDLQQEEKEEKKRKNKDLLTELCIQNKEEILCALSRLDIESLEKLFSDYLTKEELSCFLRKNVVMKEMEEDIQSVQGYMDRLWENYRFDYELFKKIKKKGDTSYADTTWI